MELFTNEEQVQLNALGDARRAPFGRGFFDWCEEQIPGSITGPLTYAVNGRNFRVGHKSFFQVNRFLLPALAEAVVGQTGGESALELYAGVGLFTVRLQKQFKNVLAVESSASAVDDLEFNAQARQTGLKTMRSPADLFYRITKANQTISLLTRLAPD